MKRKRNDISTPSACRWWMLSAAMMLLAVAANAEPYALKRQWSLNTQAGTGKFAPFYQASNRNGMGGAVPYGAYITCGLSHPMADTTRFSYGWGVELMAGYNSKIDYDHFTPSGTEQYQGIWSKSAAGPGDWYVPQLYGEMRLHSLFLTLGMKPYDRSIFDSPIGTGDYVLSRNARPMPQIRVGLTDFTDVPFTRGWLQVLGEFSYGWMLDASWQKKQFSRYCGYLTTGVKMHHKRVYFRVGGHRPVTFTIGLQHGAQFGGTRTTYFKGTITDVRSAKGGLGEAAKMFLPLRDENYYDGNHLGSWDLQLRYRMGNGHTLTAYCQHPWEDGSGVGCLNGWDGIYGLRYRRGGTHIVSEAVVEYLDFMNQSGPMHWAPGDFPGTGITAEATGADNYYNNYFYDGWANYGMALGNPFFKSPAYNLDGYPAFTDNRLRGFHAGISGYINDRWAYRLMGSHRTTWGTYFQPAPHRRHATCVLAGASWLPPLYPGLAVNASLAYDSGSLYGDNFGVNIALTYQGDFSLKRKKQTRP